MNLIDSASLVVTPNAYKTSKLYSIVPTDGTGDMTFARTGDTATRINSAGLIESVLANRPRLDYLGGSCPKLLIEPQRTNLQVQSQDITSASWTKTNAPTIVGNVSVAPDGTTTADTFVDTTGGTFKDFNSGGSITALQVVTLSFFIKKETTRTNFGGGRIAFFGGTSKSAWFYWNETTGQLLQSASSTITPTFKSEDYGTYWRFSVTATSETGHNFAGTYFYPTLSTNGTSNGAGVGSVRTIWGIQLEVGSFSTSYIPTTTASVTRNADQCYDNTATTLIGQTEGTIFIDFDLNNIPDTTIRNIITLGLFGANYTDRIVIAQSALASGTKYRFQFRANNTSLLDDLTLSYTSGRTKLAVKYNSSSMQVFLNGVLVKSFTYTATAFGTSLTTVYLGNFTNINEVNGHRINSAILWKTRLSDQELVTLTSL
jgi:hypothetical protein